jgi:broad specificity phosphatase PhoE
MIELTLVRHGQARTGAKDEASYDSLSDLGHQQARWLGEHFRSVEPFEKVISGVMTRQVQTANGFGLQGVPHEQDARLNELDYFALAQSLFDSHGIEIPGSAQEFMEHVPKVLSTWMDGGMHKDIEPYEAFCTRITSAVLDAARAKERCVLVTSTGVIATLVAQSLRLDPVYNSNLFLRVMNTSVHKFVVFDGEFHLSQFGAVPHLDPPERAYARTFI